MGAIAFSAVIAAVIGGGLPAEIWSQRDLVLSGAKNLIFGKSEAPPVVAGVRRRKVYLDWYADDGSEISPRVW